MFIPTGFIEQKQNTVVKKKIERKGEYIGQHYKRKKKRRGGGGD